jgi:hypothetical protein
METDPADMAKLSDSEVEEDLPFNCAPVKKSLHFDDGSGMQRSEPLRLSANVRDLAVRFNSRRKATLHTAIRGLATGYVDQDTSGNYDPSCERRRTRNAPSRVRNNKRQAVGDRQHRHKRRVGEGMLVVLQLRGKALEYAQSIPAGPFPEFSDTSDIGTSDDDGPRKPRTRATTGRTKPVR